MSFNTQATHVGIFVDDQDLRHIIEEEEQLALGIWVRFDLLADTEKICDIRFQMFGPGGLVELCERFCSLCFMETFSSAKRIIEDIDMSVPYSIICVQTLQRAIAALYTGVPVDNAHFMELSAEQQLEMIEQVLTDKVRPFLIRDGGDLKVLKLENFVLLVEYEGACQSCPASSGGTLAYIQQVLQEEVHEDLVVQPQFEEEPWE